MLRKRADGIVRDEVMERAKAKAVLEAILFTMGDSVAIDRLAADIE